MNYVNFTYLILNFITVFVPVIFSFHPKLQFYKKWKLFFIANISIAAIFILWDMLFTKHGIWGFNNNYITGIYLANLPIEEVLFFICIPFSCVFTYHCLNLFFTFKWKNNMENFVVILFSIILLITGIYYHQKLYTATTFISLGIFILTIKYIAKVTWLPNLISIYPVLLIPFFIINGVLTGTGLEHPIVWYNNSENLGIRLLTIPIEDIFYGFELIVANLFLFELFDKKNKAPKHLPENTLFI